MEVKDGDWKLRRGEVGWRVKVMVKVDEGGHETQPGEVNLASISEVKVKVQNVKYHKETSLFYKQKLSIK